jgi:endonuclease/exonuclease/phosphatase family metal-dependent hydrolase
MNLPTWSALAIALIPQAAIGAEPLRIATWNCEAMFSVRDVQQRSTDLREFARAVKPDILMLQEVTSQSVVEAMRDVMELKGKDGKPAWVICSDFIQNDQDEYSSLEVAVISRFPWDEVIEYDPTPDNSINRGEPPERRLIPPAVLNPPRRLNQRGYLCVRFDEFHLEVITTHLKSSRGQYGQQDLSNAQLREYITGGIAEHIALDSKEHPNFTYIVGGDFNVGVDDREKNGVKLDVEGFNGGRDGVDPYDETHALLSGGLIRGLRMRALAKGAGQSFVGPGSGKFARAGAIDNLYTSGPLSTKFTPAVRARASFGSDHLPMMTEVILP